MSDSLSPRRTNTRIVSRDGSPLVRDAHRHATWRDAYHVAMTVPWPRLLLGVFAVYVGVNVAFAGLYRLGGDCIANAEPESFSDALFFSVQTFATIGYGAMAPKTTWAHVVVALEAFLGMGTMALSTGLMFARFSSPKARVTFADVAVVTKRNGVPTLMFRLANDRANSIVEARLRVAVTRMERTAEGEVMRRFHDLPLERSENILFALTWTAMHPLREDSPLAGLSQADLERERAEIAVSFIGLDATTNQTVHARWSYLPSEILVGRRYVDIITLHGDGTRTIDFGRIHETRPEEPAPG